MKPVHEQLLQNSHLVGHLLPYDISAEVSNQRPHHSFAVVAGDQSHHIYYPGDQQHNHSLTTLPAYPHTHLHHPNLAAGPNVHHNPPPGQQHHHLSDGCGGGGGGGHFRRSLSGSETDISTSTENLTPQEQYVLRNSTRQEPQGEETLDLEDSGGGTGSGTVSGLPSLPYRGGGSWISATTGLGSSYASMDQSSCKTLIIHNMDHDDDFRDDDDCSGAEAEDDEDFGDDETTGNPISTCGGGDGTRDGRRTPSAARHHRYRSRSNRSGDDSGIRQHPACRGSAASAVGGAPSHYCQQPQHHLYQHPSLPQYPGAVPPPHYSASGVVPPLPQEISDIPRHYLDQSEVLKHLLAKEMAGAAAAQLCGVDAASLMMPYGGHVPPYVHQAFFGTDFDLSQLPPPPEYPGGSAAAVSAAVSKMSIASPSSETTDGSTTATSPSDSSPGFPAHQLTGMGSRGGRGPPVSAPASAAGLLSRSQPDLSRLGRWAEDGRRSGHFSPRPRTKGKASPDVPPSLLHQRAQQHKYGFGGFGGSVDGGGGDGGFDKLNRALLLENRQLKAELDIFTTKVSRLQKFEVDIQKVHQAYEELVKSSQKRESLNAAVRGKLELEVRRLHDISKELKDQLDTSNGNLQRRSAHDDQPEVGKQELQCRDEFIAQLIQQNKELTAAKERHEIELAAQRVTLQEQRTHIDILDSALTNAQANVVKLEDECRKKAAYVDRVAQLQRALTALQVASERREQMERKLRNQLERDLNELRQRHLVAQQAARGGRPTSGAARSGELTGAGSTGELRIGGSGSGGGGSGGKVESAESSERAVDDLKSAVRAKEERIMALETDVSKWEQRYLEENAMRQMAIDAASMPKDAKIAALERTSQESEKLIAEARTDRLRQMDELHLSHRRCADLEGRTHDLESRLAERDAMIKVLQKHQIDRDAAFRSAVLRSPRHTPHASFHAACASSTSSARSGSANALFSLHTASGIGSQEEMSGAATGVKAHPAGGMEVGATGSDASLATDDAAEAAAVTQDSLDEQLKKLDSQLLSKDSIINALRSEKEKYPSHYWMV